MGAWSQLRERIWRWQLGRFMRQRPTQRRTVSYDALRSIAVLYQADRPADVLAVQAFAEKHRREGREVILMGFARKAPENWPAERPLLTAKDSNWFLRPRGETADAFLEQPFDLLVGAWMGPCLPLHWLAVASHAAWRAGENHPAKEDAAELLLALPKAQNTVKALLQQLDHYLPAIRTKVSES